MIRLFLLSLLISACAKPQATLELTLAWPTPPSQDQAPDPTHLRDTLSARLQLYKNLGLLQLNQAQPEGETLHLSLSLPGCDPEHRQEALQHLRALWEHPPATFLLSATAPTKALAQQLRTAFDTDVLSDFERPGLLTVSAPPERVTPTLPAEAIPISAPAGQTSFWLRDPSHHLDARTIASLEAHPKRDLKTMELRFTPEGAQALAALSEAALGKPILVLIDDALALTPRIGSRLKDELLLVWPPDTPADTLAAFGLATLVARDGALGPLRVLSESCHP